MDVSSSSAASSSSSSSHRVGSPSSHNHLILIDPDDLTFTNVKINQTYSQTLRLTNPLTVPVEFTIRAGTPHRYTLSQTEFKLFGGETCLLEIRLRCTNRMPPLPKSTTTINGRSNVFKDVFHLRSSLFTQRFHATWYPFGALPVSSTPQSTRRGQTAHDLPDSTLAGYQAEGGAEGIKNQRIDPVAKAAAIARKEAREQKKLDDAAAASAAESTRLAKEAAAEAERQKHLFESELMKPFERVSLQSARANASVTAMIPPSVLAASTASASSSSDSATPGVTHGGSAVSTKEFLALSQKCRALQATVDEKTIEVQQWEFNYNALESEYRFVLEQLESLQSSVRSAGDRPSDALKCKIESLLQRDRLASQQVHNELVASLTAKDAALRCAEEEIRRLSTHLEQRAYEFGELEEELEQTREEERRLRLQVMEMKEMQQRGGEER